LGGWRKLLLASLFVSTHHSLLYAKEKETLAARNYALSLSYSAGWQFLAYILFLLLSSVFSLSSLVFGKKNVEVPEIYICAFYV
jgi:hypothetical protein